MSGWGSDIVPPGINRPAAKPSDLDGDILKNVFSRPPPRETLREQAGRLLDFLRRQGETGRSVSASLYTVAREEYADLARRQAELQADAEATRVLLDAIDAQMLNLVPSVEEAPRPYPQDEERVYRHLRYGVDGERDRRLEAIANAMKLSVTSTVEVLGSLMRGGDVTYQDGMFWSTGKGRFK